MRIFPTKRGWKRLAIALAILLSIALIANGFMAWRTKMQIDAEVAAIRAAGHPATISDLAPQPIPAEKNAAAILESLRPRIDEFAKEHAHFLDRTPLGQQYSADRERIAPSAEQVAAIQAIVEKYPDLESGIAAAAACDQYASVADFTLGHRETLEDLLDRAQPFRSLARFCDWKMEVLIAEGQPQQAGELGLQMLHLAQLRNKEPFLVSYLVNLAVRGIVCSRLAEAFEGSAMTAGLHSRIDKELSRQDNPDGLLQSLITERALAGTYTLSNGLLEPDNSLWIRMVGWPVKRWYLGALQSFEPMFALAAEPWYVVNREPPAKSGSNHSTGGGVLADLLQPALQAGLSAQARNLVALRALRIANALAKYRAEHGHEAAGLADLQLPEESTLDPFSGKPLLLKHTDDGWLIYSVGTNRTDDGGNFTDQKDHGLGPRKNP